MPDNKFKRDANNSPRERNHPPFLSVENIVAIYTILQILWVMKQRLGLEAMLEYINTYLNEIENNNPFLKKAVNEAMQLISVEKLYKDMTNDEKIN